MYFKNAISLFVAISYMGYYFSPLVITSAYDTQQIRLVCCIFVSD